jgi:hypothetical protein
MSNVVYAAQRNPIAPGTDRPILAVRSWAGLGTSPRR